MNKKNADILCLLVAFLTLNLLSQEDEQVLFEKAYHYYLQKNPHAALTALKEILTINPQNPQAVLLTGNILYLLNKPAHAASMYKKIIQHYPNNCSLLHNCALACDSIGDFHQAQIYFEQLKKILNPNDAKKIDPFLEKIYLRTRQWDKAYEYCTTDLSKYWWFTTDTHNKNILLNLIANKNGFGDAIQFIRYAQWLAQAGAHVTVLCYPNLNNLFELCPFISHIIHEEPDLQLYDAVYRISIDGLMLLAHKHEPTIEPITPYLYADQQLVTLWKERLQHDTNFKIGLCWQSSPIQDYFSGSATLNPRSIPTKYLEPLSAIPGVSFYSLQKWATMTDFPLSIRVFDQDFDDSHGRFMDTAALIKNLDLIISVDTSIAHLAGALGAPVWLLLNYCTDYRWFSDKPDIFLYPSMRLFRQPEYSDWQSVINQIVHELK